MGDIYVRIGTTKELLATVGYGTVMDIAWDILALMGDVEVEEGEEPPNPSEINSLDITAFVNGSGQVIEIYLGRLGEVLHDGNGVPNLPIIFRWFETVFYAE